MPSITSWTRLEPRSRSNDLGTELQAQVHDALWLLARQWQLGELTGEDVASPASVQVHAEILPVTGLRLGSDGSFDTYDRTIPLETVVEREPGPNLAHDLSFAVDAGLHLLRLLSDKRLGRFKENLIRRYPLTADEHDALDAQSESFVRLMSGRVPDGCQLLEVFGSEINLQQVASEIGIDASDIDAFSQVVSDWRNWWQQLYSGSPGDNRTAWRSDRMEYTFALSAGNSKREVILASSEYHGGRLDWFDFVAGEETEFPNAGEPKCCIQTLLPGVASYPGMPLARWWELEDARVDFGRIEMEPGDLPRQLLLAYAVVYSNDWFLIPVELPVGSITRVKQLIVKDTFGEQTLIQQAGQEESHGSGWSLFRLSHASDPSARLDGLFLASALPDSFESTPIEEVRFLRDEMANMAWAIERTAESRTGRPLNRQEQYEARRRAEPPRAVSTTSRTLSYRLATDIPDHWFPLLPVGASRLQCIDSQPREGIGVVRPSGQLLQPDGLQVFEEEIPREGVRITRAWQQARWSNGSTHVWRGRRKLPGTGEGSSGLLFDIVEFPEGAA